MCDTLFPHPSPESAMYYACATRFKTRETAIIRVCTLHAEGACCSCVSRAVFSKSWLFHSQLITERQKSWWCIPFPWQIHARSQRKSSQPGECLCTCMGFGPGRIRWKTYPIVGSARADWQAEIQPLLAQLHLQRIEYRWALQEAPPFHRWCHLGTVPKDLQL